MIGFGWNHPDGGPTSSNPIGKYIKIDGIKPDKMHEINKKVVDIFNLDRNMKNIINELETRHNSGESIETLISNLKKSWEVK